MSQNRPQIRYEVVHCGILSWMHRNHESARSLSEALRSLAKTIDLEGGEGVGRE